MPLTTHINHLRAWLGGIAISLGVFGLLLFSVVYLLLKPMARFEFPGSTVRPTQAQQDARAARVFWSGVVPLFLGSVGLIAFGVYEMKREKLPRD
ncbi:MAG: hypothetical protein K0Q55_4108 [Verrucomicrobia bacterium]|jgi:hypothetical protein|nr:hypothetical protein [Verrucomicrobiota bacterium]